MSQLRAVTGIRDTLPDRALRDMAGSSQEQLAQARVDFVKEKLHG